MSQYYTGMDALVTFVQQQQKGHVVVGYYPMPKYAGMALYIGFAFDMQASKFDLNLEWMSLGLDLFGDTLQGGYQYRFGSFAALVDYLQSILYVKVKDIPVKFKFDATQFLDPIKNAAEQAVFEEAWQRFKIDFRKEMFLDSDLQLIHTTMP